MAKMKLDTFLDRQSDRLRFPMETGKKFAYKRELRSNPTTGKKEIVKVDTINTYNYIQSFKDSCDINVLIQRFANGDESALGIGRTPSFIDCTQMPKTLAEAQSQLIEAENYFNSLPVEVRAKFGHDAGQFFAEIGSDEFNKKLGIEMPVTPPDPVVVPDKVKEVAADVQKSE